MSLDECFKSGMLRKHSMSGERVSGAIDISADFLKKAKSVFEIEQYEIALLMAYNCMFHAARALLYNDGVTERSHYCMILYLKNKFVRDVNILKYVDVLDSYRNIRHSIQYGGESCSELDANEGVRDAENFLKEVKTLLSKH